MLCGVGWQLVTDISGKCRYPTTKLRRVKSPKREGLSVHSAQQLRILVKRTCKQSFAYYEGLCHE